MSAKMDDINTLLSEARERPLNLALDAIGQGETAVFGAGEGYNALERSVLQPLNIKPYLVIDQKFGESVGTFAGVDAISVKNLKKYLKPGSNVIFTIGNKELVRRLCANHFSENNINAIWAPEIYEYNLHHYDQEIVASPKKYFTTHEAEIRSAFSKYRDLESREVFLSVLKKYTTGAIADVPHRELKEQYILEPGLMREEPKSYLCCGAYNGDTISSIVENYPTLKKVWAFEPDLSNFKAVSDACRKLSEDRAIDFTVYPCGVYSTTGFLSFDHGKGLSARISPNGKGTILTVLVDEIAINQKFEYVTVDIEGAEEEFIKGAADQIRVTRPTIAISAYHHPSHVWRLQRMLSELVPEYRFYLRNYTGYAYETVLYAVS